MPRYVHPKTGHAIETSHPAEGVQLRAQGYREQKARTAAVKQADQAQKTDSK